MLTSLGGCSKPRSPLRMSSPTSGVPALRAAFAELREEVTALRDCLADAELLDTQTFLAQLHRRRFNAVRQAYPCDCISTLGTVLASNELLGLTSLHCAGLKAVGALACTSSATYRNVQVVSSYLHDSLTRLYVAGGADGHQALNSAERFDADSMSWQTLPPMSSPRAAAASTVVFRRLYVCGGMSGSQELSSVECFIPAACLWEPLPPLHQARGEAVAGMVAGRLCVLGGICNQRVLGTVEGFNFEEGVWEALGSLLQPRAEASAGSIQGCLHVCGGHGSEHREALASMERLDDGGVAWKAMMPLKYARYGAAAVVLRDQLYVYGGHDGRDFLCFAERFDPRSGTWENIAPLTRPRAGAAALSVAGRVYICGGYDGQRALAIAERWTSETAARASGRACTKGDATNVWENLTPLAQGRASAVAAALLG
eukprot:TRINITY_DN63548_c0_g1_i1.p1 TRINITY_DN63548_c0_g1~~TRINITY_DN63548_c0_g1_i1.p1  ORF type:complete len:465 (-),score=71.62 TRINITY_DN63548_c0_g1_i1:37-1323(-)